MKRTQLVLLILVPLLLLTLPGCARNWTRIEPGLTKETIVQRLGKPNLVSNSKKGNLVWIYTDRDLNDLPHLDEESEPVDGQKTLLLDLSEKNPQSGFSRRGPYRMILTLIFTENGTLERYEYGYVERIGPIPRW